MTATTELMQAWGAILQAGFACLGIVGLGFYAVDTRSIKNAMLSQNEAAMRPFFVANTADAVTVAEIKIRNIGNGPAIAVTFNFCDDPDKTLFDEYTNEFAVGEEKPIRFLFFDSAMTEIVERSGLRITYQNLAGKTYWTEVRVETQEMRVRATITHGEVAGDRKRASPFGPFFRSK